MPLLRNRVRRPRAAAAGRAALASLAAAAWLAAVPPAAAQDDPEVLQFYDTGARLLNLQEFGRQVTGRYPPALRASRITGAVLLRYRILADGRVDSASVSAVQATDPAFVEPALAIGRQLVFSPPQVGGRPVALWSTFEIRFSPPLRPGEYPREREPVLRDAGEVERQLAALYPPALLAAPVRGSVVTWLRILPDGTVDSASVVAVQATNPAFVEPAIAAARRMTFTPAKEGRRPVEYWQMYVVRFRAPPPTR